MLSESHNRKQFNAHVYSLGRYRLNLPCSREVKGVHEAEWGGSSSTTGGQVTGEVPPELGVLVDASQEDLLVLVFESEVEGLGGEVPNYVGEVAAPEWKEALFFGDTDKGIDDTWKKNINGEKSTTDVCIICMIFFIWLILHKYKRSSTRNPVYDIHSFVQIRVFDKSHSDFISCII